MAISAAIAYQKLTNHPRTFLKNYNLIVAGSAVGGQVQYCIYMDQGHTQRPGKIFKTKWMSRTRTFRISPGNGPPQGAHAFMAYSVPVQQPGQAVGPLVVNFTQLPTIGVESVMVTGLLSGCSFVVGTLPNGSTECAHVQPAPPLWPGGHVNSFLVTAYNNYKVYGKNDYDHRTAGGHMDRNVSIIGIRQNNVWKIYAQKHDILNQQSTMSVHRIYP